MRSYIIHRFDEDLRDLLIAISVEHMILDPQRVEGAEIEVRAALMRPTS